jgi:branched-chain amino acid transport system substrate-binding protein
MIHWRLFVPIFISIMALSAINSVAEIRVGIAGPISGSAAFFGEQYVTGAGLAVNDLNAKGGILGQKIELIVGDDFCDREQAIATAHKLVSDGVVFVVGHFCSHSSISASKVYEKAGILQISPGSVSAKLTDEGGPNVFRVCGRDDQQGAKVADYLARNWAGKKIAILDDGSTFGKGLANAARTKLQDLGVSVSMNETFTAGEADYSQLVSKMQSEGIEVFFPGGLSQEIALIFRQAHDRGYKLKMVAPSSSAAEDFAMIAGPDIVGTPLAVAADARDQLQAADVVSRFRAQGYEPLGFTLYAYAAVQVWAQAATAAGSLELNAVTQVMHSRQFDTVLGKISFSAKGDVIGFEPWEWYVWQANGTYVPLK